MKNCSSIIRNLLKEKNITEADLARKINTTGTNLAKWLQTEDWKISKLVNVCSALNIPITTFIDNAEIGNVITEPDVSLKHERNPFNLLSERFEEIEKDIIELKKQNATLHRDIKKLMQTRNINTNLSTIDSTFELMINRCHYINGNFYVGSWFRKILSNITQILNIIIDVNKNSLNYIQAAWCESLVCQVERIENQIKNYEAYCKINIE